jgi:hypothetical protein
MAKVSLITGDESKRKDGLCYLNKHKRMASEKLQHLIKVKGHSSLLCWAPSGKKDTWHLEAFFLSSLFTA